MSFLSWYISAALDLPIIALDNDPLTKQSHMEILQRNFNLSETQPEFHQGSLQKLPFKSEEFDIAFCISVLEHTRNYEKVIREIWRVLKVGGLLILTFHAFDVSLDGSASIPLTDAQKLLETLWVNLKPVNKTIVMDLTQDIFTTSKYYNNLSEADWRRYHGSWFTPNLTFFATTWTKEI